MGTASLTVNLRGPEPNSPVSVFHQGQTFFLAGSRCLLNFDVGPAVMQCLVSPGVVNLCLAIELFFKSVLVAQGETPPKSHKLVDLAKLVPSSFLDGVKSAYHKRVPKPTFDELLDQVNEHFVKVRYGYEFDVFAYQEHAVFVLANAIYCEAAPLHNIKVGVDRIRA